MTDIIVRPLDAQEIGHFKRAIQQAFQLGYEAYFGKTQDCILPEKDIEDSLTKKGAQAYGLWIENRLAGGAVVVVDPDDGRGFLDLLYVNPDEQSRGLGMRLWQALLQLYPDVVEWQTETPYFDVRNIHFYVNKCGFHIVEFFHPHHPDPGQPASFIGDGGMGMFVFRKTMSRERPQPSSAANHAS